MKLLNSWNTLHTIIYFATGNHPRVFTTIDSYPESRHIILKWWYNIQGYDYNKRNSSGVERKCQDSN